MQLLPYTGAAGRLLPFVVEAFTTQLNELDQVRAEPHRLDIIDCICSASVLIPQSKKVLIPKLLKVLPSTPSS